MTSEPVNRVRRSARAFQILLALGLLSAIVGGVISGSLVPIVRDPIEALPGFARAVALVAVLRLWVLVVAPLSSFLAGRVLPVRPWVCAVAIAAWGEGLFIAIDVATGGWPSVYGSASWFLGRAVTWAMGVGLGVLLARAGRARAVRAKARVEAESEATRQRYARWLEDEAKKGS